MLKNIVRYVQVVPKRGATGVVRDVYRQARAEIGLLPEAVTMFSASPELLAASWAPFRELLLSTGQVPRAHKEAVAAAVSQLNECPFCVDAHTIMLYGGGAGEFADRLLTGHADEAADETLRALYAWVVAARTRPAAPLAAPFGPAETPEIVGTFLHFQFLNRVIDVLLSDTFLPGNPKRHVVARKVAGRVMSRRIKASRDAGGAIGLDVEAELPPDLAWAAGSPTVAAALATLAWAARRAAARTVPPAVVAMLDGVLAGWDGTVPGPSRAWLEEPLGQLPAALRPTGRIALLTALAPFQLLDDDVTAFRVEHPEDGQLLDVVTWAAFTAARRIGAWAVPADLALADTRPANRVPSQGSEAAPESDEPTPV